MLSVIRDMWALLGGIGLLMVGNGMQGTLLSLRGDLEGFDPFSLALITSAYFIGFLLSARTTPNLIARVGHVRVFAALASIISAVFILYAAIVDEVAWFIMRVIVGYCFCGVYVVAESWLNDGADNESRGKTLSVYMIVQMGGIIAAQAIVNFAPASDYLLFVIISVLVSISFAPILLSISPAPVFQTARRMTLRQLFDVSPLGVFAALIMGGVFSACFGMAAVYGTQRGMSVAEISIFVGAIYLGALLAQYPIGWLSDRFDRRQLITVICVLASVSCTLGVIGHESITLIVISVFLFGGMSMPLYSLILAYTNDYLEHEDMASASGGILFVNGIGAIAGAPVLGFLMGSFGSWMFFVFNGALTSAIALYALYRMTQRASVAVDDTMPYVAVAPQGSPVAVEVASEVVVEQYLSEEDETETEEGAAA